MKQIGTTPSGGALIELTPEEQVVLKNALNALDGDSFPRFLTPSPFRGLQENDISPLFSIIALWVEQRFALNKSRAVLDELQAIMDGKRG